MQFGKLRKAKRIRSLVLDSELEHSFPMMTKAKTERQIILGSVFKSFCSCGKEKHVKVRIDCVEELTVPRGENCRYRDGYPYLCSSCLRILSTSD